MGVGSGRVKSRFRVTVAVAVCCALGFVLAVLVWTSSGAVAARSDKTVRGRIGGDTLRSDALMLLAHRIASSQTIFVNVAAFRDVLCVATVREIFDNAKHPERISLGVIDQRIPNDRVCIPPEYLRYVPNGTNITTTAPPNVDPEYLPQPNRFVSCFKKSFCPSDSIRVRYVDWTEARGPTYGRFVAGLMYQGESFYMMIDSHSRFALHFDEFMILDVMRLHRSYSGETGNEGRGGVLSYYPPIFNRHDVPLQPMVDIMAMCRAVYVKDLAVLRNQALWIRSPKRPLLQPYTAAGFLFSDATAQMDVPFDPYLDYVFDGEEILYTVRLFTSGYDAYSPSRGYIFHHYERHKAPRFWSIPGLQWGTIQGKTRQRVHYFLETYVNQTERLMVDKSAAKALGVDIAEERYGLGTIRPIDAFYRLAYVNRSGWDVDQNKYCRVMAAESIRLNHEYLV